MTFGQVRLLVSSVSLAFFGAVFSGSWSLPSFTWGEPPASVLQSKCEPLWNDGARNDPALQCYLTSQVDRLCKPGEKAHLLWLFTRYEKDKATFEGKLRGYLLAVQFGMARGGGDDTLKTYNRVSKEEALKLKSDAAFVKAMKLPTVTDSELTAFVSKLAAKGYLSRNDFGWRSPSWVTDAFTEDLKVTPVCASPQA